MTLNDKRKVIGVLLCCGQDPQDPWTGFVWETTGATARALGVSTRVDVDAHRQWQSTRRHTDGRPPHGEICIEAAYRLIESSATLRREWFGAP